ncbi:hypothetical protein DSO57_1033405 [Entomophthora muscae]|uniref:Uncharacterized protein n=1 Tax=Entomophthora muscae TaxID=34485 RepID=A0ACC2RR45_9FUNG|nr:hypothetical protein DSO57_1033405 [Entomophthora muscae]
MEPSKRVIAKWEEMDTWMLLDALVGMRSAFQNIRRHPNLWEQVSAKLTEKGIYKSKEKCRNRWKVLVAKYKRYCSQTLRKVKVTPFQYYGPMDIILSSQLQVKQGKLIRKFKNGEQVMLATEDSELAPIRKVPPKSKLFDGDPWSSELKDACK